MFKLDSVNTKKNLEAIITNIKVFNTSARQPENNKDFIVEEAKEMLSGFLYNDRKEIIDGVADVLFTGIAYLMLNHSDIFDWELFMGKVEKNFDIVDNVNASICCSVIAGAVHGVINTPLDDENIVNFIRGLIELMAIATAIAIKINMAPLVALYKVSLENLSKTNYPQELEKEVFRDGKLQKKDLSGKNYPWYEPVKQIEWVMMAGAYMPENYTQEQQEEYQVIVEELRALGL